MKVILRYRNLILALLIILVFFKIVSSIFSRYSLENETFRIKKREIQETEKTIAKWNRLRTEYNKLSRKLSQKDTLFFKKIVEQKAKASNVRIVSLAISRTDKDFFSEAIMSLSFFCSYENLQNFVQSLEESNIKIERIKMRKGEKSDVEVGVGLKGFIVE